MGESTSNDPIPQPAVLRPKNWHKFQHYAHRRPPWIKFHRSLLDDPTYLTLPVASMALAPLLWLLASESADGSLTSDVATIAWRIRWTEPDVLKALNPLIRCGLFIDASDVLSLRKQDATSEGETEYRVQSTETPLTPQGGNGSVSVKTLHRRKRKAAAGIETLDVLGNREWIDAYNELLNAKLEYGPGNLQAVQRARDHGYTIDQAKQTFQALAEQSTPLAKWCVEHRKWDLEFLIRPPHSRQGNWTLGMIDKIHNELASGMVNE